MSWDPTHRLLGDALRAQAAERPDQDLFVHDGRHLSYAEVRDQVATMAKALIAMGVEPGDRVAFFGAPRPEFVIHLLAAADVGAIWLGLNPKYTAGELDHVVGDAEPKLVFGFSTAAGEDLGGVLDGIGERHPGIERIVVDGWDDLLAEGAEVGDADLAARREAVDALDPCVLVYTSGSTGRPKGALLTHRGFSICNEIAIERKGLSGRSIICNLPINHVGAIGDICARCMAGGTIWFQEAFSPDLMMRTIESERLNTWGGVPTIFQVCVNHPTFDEVDLTSVDLLAWGGAAMPADLLETLMEKTDCRRATMGYGSTELTGGVTYSGLEDTIDNYCATIGTADDRQPIRVWHPDGREAEPGEAGEIQALGDYTMAGYWRNPEATEAAFDDGWLHTGDLVVQRADGYYSIVGRLSEMFKSGGYNVYPREVELALEEHPGVGMAAVVSVPDPTYQEVGHAFVMPDGGAVIDLVELTEFARTKLANYKVPKLITVDAELPMLAIGKVDKVALRDRARSGA